LFFSGFLNWFFSELVIHPKPASSGDVVSLMSIQTETHFQSQRVTSARPIGLIPKAAPASKLYSILVLLLNFTINLKPPEPVYPVAEIITFSIPAKFPLQNGNMESQINLLKSRIVLLQLWSLNCQ
jgi:hypothetical protein